ncbi:MAG: hypothetical protein O2894_07035 [Planctomycetota bacterium]|nr:hypothetical protein [Planctomycetota bacterium]
MRASRLELALGSVGVALRRTGTMLREVLLLVGPIRALEAVGPYTRGDGFDLMLFCGALLAGILLLNAARAGWMPWTVRAVHAVARRGRTWGRRILPRQAMAFRPTADARPLPDRALVGPILVLLALLFGLLALGPNLYVGLRALKTHVAYTPYLALLVSIWALLLVTVLACALCFQQWLAAASRRRGGSSTPYVGAIGAWLVGMAALIALPGIVAVLAVLVVGFVGDRILAAAPARDYLYCRRDALGRPLAVRVQAFLRRQHATLALALAVVVTIGQADRLWWAHGPRAPFEFTGWMGLMASLAAVGVAGVLALEWRRLLGGRATTPEVTLTPTLWIRRPASRELGSAEERQENYWYRVARLRGWLVLRATSTPKHPWDLVLGSDDHPRRFAPREPLDEHDAQFQLERRFHIVMRRRFHRQFERLFKAARAETPEGGTGFLVCPHAWMVAGVVRDIDPTRRRSATGSLTGPRTYGPPFAQSFEPRVRRYIGAILRTLEIDVIFLDDGITWRDIRRVLSVAYEIHDQGRAPLRERHFLGVPRVRVAIQEEPAEPEPPKAIPDALDMGVPDPSGGAIRVLLILRDRGARDDIEVLDPVDTGLRTPQLV